jgi:aspartyl-tRNA(Asn)/glutamyl-tRNA(Gln) amidotransferase subunit C
MINKEEIDHVAELARIELTDTEKEKFTTEVDSILNYINELQTADTAGITKVIQTSGLADIARSDVVVNTNDRNNLLRNAPQQESGFYKVKKVFENNG